MTMNICSHWHFTLGNWLYIWHHSGPWSDFSYLGHSKNYWTELRTINDDDGGDDQCCHWTFENQPIFLQQKKTRKTQIEKTKF